MSISLYAWRYLWFGLLNVQIGMLDEVMLKAIQLNRVDFVDLFLDHGVSLKDFLTPRRLLTLYNEVC